MFHHTGMVLTSVGRQAPSMAHLNERRYSRTHVRNLRRTAGIYDRPHRARSAFPPGPDPGHTWPALPSSLSQSRFPRAPMPPFPPGVNIVELFYCYWHFCIVYNMLCTAIVYKLCDRRALTSPKWGR